MTPPADVAEPVDDLPAPRALPDLRFKWVGESPAFLQGSNIGVSTGVDLVHDAQEFAYTPLQISLDASTPGSQSWEVVDFSPRDPIELFRSTAKFSGIAFLDAALADEGLVVSIDLHTDVFAVTTVRPQAGIAPYSTGTGERPRGELDAFVASEAARGFVMTALSIDPATGDIRFYEASREGDSTAYETEVRDVTSANAFAQATALADAGYIITAFGRVGDDAAIMIGTRAPGAAPRTVTLQTTPDLSAGDAVVAWIFGSPNDQVIVQR